jgi:hypothetical protein
MAMSVIGLVRIGEGGGDDDFARALPHEQGARGGGLREKRDKNQNKWLGASGHDEDSRNEP